MSLLKKIKDSSVYITPNFPVLETRRYKFSLLNVLTVIGIYSFFVTVLVITILALTPAKEFIFIFENEKLTEQVEKVKKLESEVVFLTRQLEKLASTNEKLKYAMILASSDTLDSTSAVYDSLKRTKRRNVNVGGNILTPFKKLFFESEKEEDESVIFLAPVEGVIVKNFDTRSGHFGIDYGVKEDSPVYASLGGIVTFAGYTAENGYVLIIDYGEGYLTIYKHCSALLKKERDNVIQGELVALSGNSGYKSSGPHLHFEIWYDGKAVNPSEYIINR